MDAPGRNEPPQTWLQLLHAVRWPLALMLTVLGLAFVGYLVYRETTAQLSRAVGGIGDAVGSIAERFRTEKITETFVAALPEITGTGVGHLEVAQAEAVETLTRSDERLAFWDLLPLGTTVTEIRVPVIYRWHVDLGEDWELEVEGQTCIVHAPPLRPSLPPAIRTDRMETRIEEGLLRTDGAEQLAALQKSLTPRLVAIARQPEHLELAREEARRTVAEFVKTWLLREDHWRNDRFRAVLVTFADEEPAQVEAVGPSVVLGE